MKICKRCNAETNRDKYGKCIPCRKLWKADWYKKNPEKVAEMRRQYCISKVYFKNCTQCGNGWVARRVNSTLCSDECRERDRCELVKYCRTCNADTLRNGSGACIACAKAYSAAYKASNPNYSVKYYAANLDAIKANQAAWYKENREKALAYVARRRLDNMEVMRIYSHNRRARERANGGKLSTGLAAKLFKLQRGKCPCCKLPLGADYHLDHITPIKLGGTNEDWNIQLLRATCNHQKHAKHPVDFMQSRGFLL